ncbi:MAG: P1 family peptidase [Promethearchaeota archaeon]|jgi:L-aminopeptidase/D-esterase-like protein
MVNLKLANNDDDLKPNLEIRDPILNFDFPGIRVGIAQYEEGPTGCTVFYFDKTEKKENSGARFYADVRGGAPGVRFHEIGFANAICFAGGSLLGLEACDGVAAELLKMNNYSAEWFEIPVVPGAIIFDYGPRNNSVYPDKELGRAAFRSIKEGVIPLGQQGAGRLASVGKGFDYTIGELSGQGAAFKTIGDIKILVCSVVDAMGAIRDRSGKIVRGNLDRRRNTHIELLDQLKELDSEKKLGDNKNIPRNTTLTIIITNLKFDQTSLVQIAKQVHSSMSRVIDPFHTLDDGDVLFMVTTEEIEKSQLSPMAFGMIASEIVWDAVLNSFES